MKISVLPLPGVPLLRSGDDLAAALIAAIDHSGLAPRDGDVLVVCQKVVSKTEGRTVDLRSVTPSPIALRVATQTDDKDPRIVEVILRETKRIVKMERGHLIVETGPGWVCANAGVDESNSGDPNLVVLLPLDPDASAAHLSASLRAHYDCHVAVIVTDTFGRPWREGLIDFALGVAGLEPLLDLRGKTDLDGRKLHHTVMAQADALAAAAGLVMQKGSGVPAALIRGYEYTPGAGSGRDLIRAAEKDLFR